MDTKKITNLILGLSLAVLLFGTGFKLGQRNTASQIEKSSFNFSNITPKSDQTKNIDFRLP